MAENLLHTYSKYANKNINTSFINGIQRTNGTNYNISKMKAQETKLYNKYGASDFEGFRKQINEVFSSPEVRAVIQEFEAEKLSKSLQKFSLQNSQLYDYKDSIRLVFDFSKIKNSKGIQLSPKAEPIHILPKINVGDLKKIINETLGRKFHTGSDYSKGIDNLITSLVSSNALRIELGSGDSDGRTFQYKQDYEISSIPNFPWGLTKDVYEQALKDGNKVMLDEISKAIISIYRFLLSFADKAPGDKEIRQAISNVWRKHFVSGTNPALFFSGGKTQSFISGVQGALGEFQTALIFEYLQLKGMGKAVAEIKGNTRLRNTLSKEQARTDVEIFEGIGIQVKNFVVIEKEINGTKEGSFLQDIHTRIHPNKLSKYLSAQYQSDFLSFLANFYFNTDYESQHFNDMIMLRYNLEGWLAELMNMAMSDAVEDTVTFYMMGGKYFVPCSAILEASEQLSLKQHIKIYSAYQGLSDKQYARTNEEGKKEYTKYWVNNNGTWETTLKNEEQFQNLIGSRISIQTHFNFFDKIKDYILWE